MEAVPEAPDESSGNSLVKSEDGSPRHEGGRSSPPPNCAICLGRCRNKSFTDSCLHQFCFKCLLTWSRVKTECPLCKQNFKSIIHNVKSNHQYEEYPVQQTQSEIRSHSLNINEIVNAARRFRYRTTLTLPRRETLAIRQFLMHYPLAALVNDIPPSQGTRDRSRRSPTDFRRTVYRHNLWALPLPDFTGRFRDCTPEFFRYNDSQIHRLMPWLNRELYYLLNENSGHISYVMGRILELLPQHPIASPEFRTAMHCYFGDRTDHFLHEFHCFASTPYDITGYDRHVQYQTDARVSAVVNEVLSSSDSDSRDSDIVMVTSSHPAAAPAPPAPGSSRAPAPVYPRSYIPQPAVIPIETISHSDSDSDSSGVMVVGYIKPPHQRTPELVDLLASDSDVVVQEEGPPAPPAQPPPLASPEAPRSPAEDDARLERAVRLQLSVPRPPTSSDSDAYEPPPRRRRRVTPLRQASRPHPAPTPPFSSDDEDSSEDSTEDSSSSYDGRRNRTTKRKRKRKPDKASTSRSGGRTKRRCSRQRKNRKSEEREKKQSEKDKKRKGKSKNGKDVKSSKQGTSESAPLSTLVMPAPSDQPGPSGVAILNGTSAEPAEDNDRRESVRLKSVVKVMKRISDSGSGAGPSKSDVTRKHKVFGPKRRRDGAKSSNVERRKVPKQPWTGELRIFWHRMGYTSSEIDRPSDMFSSDDNIPLRQTITRPTTTDHSDSDTSD